MWFALILPRWRWSVVWIPIVPCVFPRLSCSVVAVDAKQVGLIRTRNCSCRRRVTPYCSLYLMYGWIPHQGSGGRVIQPKQYFRSWKDSFPAKQPSRGPGHWWARQAAGCRDCRIEPWQAAHALFRYRWGPSWACNAYPPLCLIRWAVPRRRSRRSILQVLRISLRVQKHVFHRRHWNLLWRRVRPFPALYPTILCGLAVRCSSPCSHQIWSGPVRVRSFVLRGLVSHFRE